MLCPGEMNSQEGDDDHDTDGTFIAVEDKDALEELRRQGKAPPASSPVGKTLLRFSSTATEVGDKENDDDGNVASGGECLVCVLFCQMNVWQTQHWPFCIVRCVVRVLSMLLFKAQA